MYSNQSVQLKIIFLISVQYKQVGGSSFGTADESDSGAGGGGGPFRFSKKDSSEVNEGEHGRAVLEIIFWKCPDTMSSQSTFCTDTQRVGQTPCTHSQHVFLATGT